MTDVQRAADSAVHIGSYCSDETKAKMSKASKGHIMPEACRLALLEANLGRHLSEETKAKMSVARANLSLETRTKLSVAHMGHHPSLETRAKISAAGVGRPMSESTRKILREANLGKHCSDEKRAKISTVKTGCLTGSLNPNWKGGLTPEYQLIRTSPAYDAWRTSVFERDHYTCQECGDSTGGNLEAHHIHEFAKYPDERFVVENGKTLCLKCHKAKRVRVAA
jgi:hypothetical protein